MAFIWNTRPAGRLDATELELGIPGLQWLHWPLLELQAETPIVWPGASLPDWLILVSPTAAELALTALNQHWPGWAQHVQLAAVGAASAAPLQLAGLDCRYPEQGASAAVADWPVWAQAQGQRVWILRGDDGRELLRERLLQQGLRVDYVPLYRRRCPVWSQFEQQRLMQYWPALAGIWLTSAAALAHLQQLVEPLVGSALYRQRLWLVSERLQAEASQQGFVDCRLLAGPDRQQLLSALCQIG